MSDSDESALANRTSVGGAADLDARQKGHLSGSTTARLRNMIVTGVLAPGQRIRERELCEAIGVSRTPVREAIKTLLQEGLVRALPNHSAVVTELDLNELQSLIIVLATVEGLAGRLACGAATDEQVAEIAGFHHQMVVYHMRGRLPDYFRANKDFHRKIVEASANPVLLSVWDMLALRVDRARYASNLWPKRWPEAIKEHQGMLDALIMRDAEQLATLMHRHVCNGLSVLVSTREPGQGSDQSDDSVA